ncbi:hypothetical protein [Paracoccus luteus]|uniref:hypothetical protein n=1 Tax=Paracoccus luteus TaxID=2508543 RepID=UPI00106F6389|nr:hypothetical protein [Paracoccus luteus]
MKALIWEAEALADTVETRRAAFNESFRAFAIDLNWDAALWRQLARHGTDAAPLRAYMAQSGHALDDATVAAIGADAVARSAALIAAGAAPLRPAAVALLADARRHALRQAVIGPTTAAELEALTDVPGSPPAEFQVVIPAARLDARLIDQARCRLDVDRADCVVVAATAQGSDVARHAGLDVRVVGDAEDAGESGRAVCP